MSASYRQAQSQCRAVCGSEREKSGRAHISYAQNYCPLLSAALGYPQHAKKEMLEALRLADMNVSEEEMELLTGCKRLEDGIAALTRHATTPVLVTPKDAYC